MDKSNNKDRYKRLCEEESSIPLFSQYWWLEATCEYDDWDVLLYEEKGEIIGSFPYYKKNMYKFLNVITSPLLTQTLGPWVKYEESMSHSSRITLENKVMAYFISNLPKFDYFVQQFHHSVTNWLSFYWSGFVSSVMYTYIIPDISDPEAVAKNFSERYRRYLKKADKELDLVIDSDYRTFYEFHKECLRMRGQEISYPFSIFESIFKAATERGQGAIFTALDKSGNKHVSLFVVWDNNSAYHLISPIDPKYKKSNALLFLTNEAIKHVSPKTKSYDFEGSMIQNVEASFRLYGTIQKPYLKISKTNSVLLRFYWFLKNR